MRIRWQIATVEVAGAATRPSLAFAPDGRPAVAFHSLAHGGLRLATANGDGTWSAETVAAAVRDSRPSLAFRFARPAISFRAGPRDEAGELRFALASGGSPPWSVVTVAPSAGDSALAFDSGHRAGISYHDPAAGTLNFARPGAGTSVWVSETVDDGPGAGAFNALAFTPVTPFGPADRPAIAWHDGAQGRIRFAAFDGTQWRRETVRDGTGWCTLAFNSAARPAVAHSNPGFISYNLRDASAGWVGGSIGGAITGALAYNPARPFERGIAYSDGHLRFAIGHESGPLAHFRVEEAGKDQAGNPVGPFEAPALAFGPAGQVGIAYCDSASQAIKFAAGTIVRTPIDAIRGIVDRLLRRR